MLQIIGWLGCLYLAVKGLEIVSSSAFRGSDGELPGFATLAAGLAFVGAAIFSVWLYEQGNGGRSDPPSYPPEYSDPSQSEVKIPANDCTAKAKNDEEMRACNN